MPFADFTGLNVSNAFQAELNQGSAFSISITADDNLFDYIRVTKQGTTLNIGLAPSTVLQSGTLRAKINMPSLDTLSANGASNVTLTGFASKNDFTASVSGASKLNGSVDVGNFQADANGSSSVTLKGSASAAILSASGASTLNLGDFTAESVNVKLDGASNATVNAKSKLDYELSGASHLLYLGKPSIGRSNSTGASSATQK